MGEKEIFILFLLTFCLITFGFQPETTVASAIASVSVPAETVSFND